MQLFGLLFVKGYKIKSLENIKEKFGIDEVLWVTHIYHYSKKLTLKISDYRNSATHGNRPKLPLVITDMQ